jgi:hypothetical protein
MIFTAFRIALCTALLTSFALFANSPDVRSFLLVALAFTAAGVWRDWRFEPYDLLSDLHKEKVKAESPPLFVFGNVVENHALDKLEQKVLIDPVLRRSRIQSIVFFWSGTLIIEALIAWKTGESPFPLARMIAYGLCFPLAYASHLSHFLFPLALSLLVTVISVSRFDEIPALPLGIYAFSVFVTLVLYRNLQLGYFARMKEDARRIHSLAWQTFQWTTGFCIVVFVVAQLFPVREPIPVETAIQKIETHDPRIRNFARKMARLEKSTRRGSRASKSGNSNSNSSGEQSPNSRDQSSANEASSKSGVDPNSGGKQSENAEQSREALQNSGKNGGAESGGKESAQPGSQSGNDDRSAGGDQNAEGSNETSSADAASNGQKQHDDEDLEKRSEEISKKIEEIAETFEKYKKLVILFAFFVIGFVLLQRYFRSQRPPPLVLSLSEKEKRALSETLRSMKARALTPQQEVIEVYNVVMDVLESVHLGREAGIPARTHIQALSRRLPRLSESFMEATDCFDQALYGEIEPDSGDLIKFRSSTRKIFRQFDISA